MGGRLKSDKETHNWGLQLLCGDTKLMCLGWIYVAPCACVLVSFPGRNSQSLHIACCLLSYIGAKKVGNSTSHGGSKRGSTVGKGISKGEKNISSGAISGPISRSGSGSSLKPISAAMMSADRNGNDSSRSSTIHASGSNSRAGRSSEGTSPGHRTSHTNNMKESAGVHSSESAILGGRGRGLSQEARLDGSHTDRPHTSAGIMSDGRPLEAQPPKTIQRPKVVLLPDICLYRLVGLVCFHLLFLTSPTQCYYLDLLVAVLFGAFHKLSVYHRHTEGLGGCCLLGPRYSPHTIALIVLIAGYICKPIKNYCIQTQEAGVVCIAVNAVALFCS